MGASFRSAVVYRRALLLLTTAFPFVIASARALRAEAIS